MADTTPPGPHNGAGSTLATNLRWLCATRPSVSLICREIGLNRQQFNRYTSGEGRPSPYTLARIAEYFGLRSEDFLLDPAAFQNRHSRQREGVGQFQAELARSFPGSLSVLRRYLGAYQTWHISPSWPDRVVCGLSVLHEHEGAVHVKSVERNLDANNEIRQAVKYVGLASLHRDRIFVVETVRRADRSIAETILHVPSEYQKNYLRGMTFGLSWRMGNTPYSSPMIWHAAGRWPDYRAALNLCGVHRMRATTLPAPVRRFFEDNPGAFTLAR